MQLSRGAGAPSVQGNLLRGIVNWSGGATNKKEQMLPPHGSTLKVKVILKQR